MFEPAPCSDEIPVWVAPTWQTAGREAGRPRDGLFPVEGPSLRLAETAREGRSALRRRTFDYVVQTRREPPQGPDPAGATWA